MGQSRASYFNLLIRSQKIEPVENLTFIMMATIRVLKAIQPEKLLFLLLLLFDFNLIQTYSRHMKESNSKIETKDHFFLNQFINLVYFLQDLQHFPWERCLLLHAANWTFALRIQLWAPQGFHLIWTPLSGHFDFPCQSWKIQNFEMELLLQLKANFGHSGQKPRLNQVTDYLKALIFILQWALSIGQAFLK